MYGRPPSSACTSASMRPGLPRKASSRTKSKPSLNCWNAISLDEAPPLGAPVVEEPMFWHDHHTLAVDLDHIGQIVVALVAAPGVALVGEDAERLARVVPAGADPADRLLADHVRDDAVDGADFRALLVRREI